MNNFEIIFIRLYDIARSVNFEKLRSIMVTEKEPEISRSRDTPDSLDLPLPLVIQLESLDRCVLASGDFSLECSSLTLKARIFEEGVMSMSLRAKIRCDLEDLHRIRDLQIPLGENFIRFEDLSESRVQAICAQIADAVDSAHYRPALRDFEDYRIFALTDRVPDTAAFIESHRNYLSAFLLGEDPFIELHESQIASTLGHPFSFRHDDIAIFDLDRCFIIDPSRDFEDLLRICEHANFQLLELRTLDRILDERLDIAEKDSREVSIHRRFRIKSLGSKLGDLQPLRFDALFILNALENSSKIIGDYYLGQIYEHLCSLFNTQGWKSNVVHSLEILQDLYSLAKGSKNERALLILEFIVVVLIALELGIFWFPPR